MGPIDIRHVSAEVVRPLRERILRPGADDEELQFPGDDHELALHVGVYSAAKLIGAGSIAPEVPPYPLQAHMPEAAFEKGASFRLRGMAVDPEFQGNSIGHKILEELFAYMADVNARWMWCNARVSAVSFYEQNGFNIVEASFELPKIGLHRLAFIER